ncbi:MAG: deoxynucleoside kinase [Chloroflexi bacterium]|nr:deoxynucleoside kinase [Chloroflexota bacterium]
MKKHFIAVAGNIGVGKSTLVELLSHQLGWEPFYEPAGENPYLEDFYRDMRAWAFPSQIFFLSRRLLAHRRLLDHPTSAIQDRSVYEDAEVFAQNLYLQRHMSERDYKTYRDLYNVLSNFLPPPDLVIFLRASVPTLQGRIAQRGRDYEQQIEEGYLERLNALYEAWITNFTLCPVLTVPADDLDYVAHDAHLRLIVSKINDKLAGQEEVIFDSADLAKASESDK